MKKNLVYMLMCAALTLAAPVDGQAMTDAQHRQFLRTSEDYRAADAQLNRAWRALKAQLPPAEFRKLLQEQREWIKVQREKEARELIAQSIPEVDAYTATITSRAKELAERAGKGSPAATAPAAKQEPAPAAAPVTPAVKPAAEAPKAEEPKAEAPKAAAPAASTPDKPARVEIGLPFLGGDKNAKAKEAAKPAPAPKQETKPQMAPQSAPKTGSQSSNGAPQYKRAAGTAEHPVATGDVAACKNLQITSTRHFGNNVPVPFVEMVLRNDAIRNVKVVRVNGYEITRALRPMIEKPQWRTSSPRTIALDVYSHTVLNDIDVEYADGTVCTIDKRSASKDFTNPYVF